MAAVTLNSVERTMPTLEGQQRLSMTMGMKKLRPDDLQRAHRDSEGGKKAAAETNELENFSKFHLNSQLPQELLLESLKFLDTKSLLQCRLVSKKINELATSVLRHRPEHKIHLKYDNSTHHFNIVEGNKTESEPQTGSAVAVKTLSDLTKFLRSHPDFPSASFTFEHQLTTAESRRRPIMKTKELKEFLQVFGHRIKSLRLVNGSGLTRKQENFHVKAFQEIFRRTPNVQHLDMSDWNHGKTTIGLDNKFFNSSNKDGAPIFFQLKHLITNYNAQTPPAILQTVLQGTGENLAKCEDGYGQGFLTDDLNLFFELDKLHTIKTLSICPDEENLEFLEKIASCPLKLSSLSIFLDLDMLLGLDLESQSQSRETMKKRVTEVINKIFKSCQHTLTSLEMEPSGFLEQVEFPVFSKLRTLQFYCEMKHRSLNCTFFPMKKMTNPRLSIQQIFPHLQNVAFNFEENDDDEKEGNEGKIQWDILFPAGVSFPTVEKLEITNVRDPRCFKVLARMFPRLKSFIFQNPCQNFPHIAPELWRNMTMIDLLKLRIDDRGQANSKLFAVDAAFTGFSVETCERLHKLSMEELCGISPKELNEWRERPSFLELQNLTFTGITLRVGHGGVLNKDKPMVTKITGACTFKLMTKLEPNICIHKNHDLSDNEIRSAYSPLAPFVNRLRIF